MQRRAFLALIPAAAMLGGCSKLKRLTGQTNNTVLPGQRGDDREADGRVDDVVEAEPGVLCLLRALGHRARRWTTTLAMTQGRAATTLIARTTDWLGHGAWWPKIQAMPAAYRVMVVEQGFGVHRCPCCHVVRSFARGRQYNARVFRGDPAGVLHPVER